MDNNNKFSTIFPYFKQLLPPVNGAKSEQLPEDLSTIDKQKSYAVSDINLIIKNICDDLNCQNAICYKAGLIFH